MLMTCQKWDNKGDEAMCGEPANKIDPHGRYLCDAHHAIWKERFTFGNPNANKAAKGQIRVDIVISDLQPLEKMLYFLTTNSGTVEDLAECAQGCRVLLDKLKG